MRVLASRALASLFALGLASTSVALAPVHAADYPTKPVTLMVGFAPGGSADIVARLLAQHLGEALGTSVVVENKPGAGGTIAASYVAGATGDGHTLLLVTSGHAGSTALYPSLTYDTVESFTPVAYVGASPVVVLAQANARYASFADVVKDAKARPGAINYAAGGGGATVTSLAAEYLKSEADLDMLQINYRGSGPALTALMAGEVDIAFDLASSSLPLVQGGKLQALAVTGSERSPLFPDAVTVSEALLPGFDVLGWFGLLAGKDTPPEVVERLNREVNTILACPDVQARFTTLGIEPGNDTPAAFRELIVNETQRSGDAIRRLGLTAQ